MGTTIPGDVHETDELVPGVSGDPAEAALQDRRPVEAVLATPGPQPELVVLVVVDRAVAPVFDHHGHTGCQTSAAVFLATTRVKPNVLPWSASSAATQVWARSSWPVALSDLSQ